jgi:two-component system, chemotaxis family, chemotaxis protein CheY
MAKILIVDDSPFIRHFLHKIITLHDLHEVAGEAENGEVAIQMYKEIQPDIVTMDICMPIKDGIEATKEIMQYDEKCKVIMCTSLSQDELKMESFEAGAIDYLVKPFTREELFKTIDKILAV